MEPEEALEILKDGGAPVPSLTILHRTTIDWLSPYARTRAIRVHASPNPSADHLQP